MKITFSKYAKAFDEACVHWNKDRKVNIMFLKLMQAHANDLLKAKRTVFLNEVYELLGLPRTQDGQIVGWHYDLVKPTGDNYIDFDLDNITESSSAIILDFNVDGKVIQYL